MSKKKRKEIPTPETPGFMEFMDDVLLHTIRLGACVLLTQNNSLTFTLLKKALKATDGNLGAQLRKLEEVGYVSVKKEFLERKPVTWYALSKKGKKALEVHFRGMAMVMHQVQGNTVIQVPEEAIPVASDEQPAASPKEKQKEKPKPKPKPEEPKKEVDEGPSLFDL